MQIHKNCEVCGTAFVAGHPNGKYCSDLCNHKAKYQRNKINKKKITKVCPECGKEYLTIFPEQICCSRKCMGARNYRIGKDKREESCLRERGYKNPSSSPIIKAKREQTALKKWNKKNIFQTDYFKEKLKVFLEKNGVAAVAHLPSVIEKKKETCMKRHNKPYACMTPQCRNASRAISSLNKHYHEILEGSILEFRLEKYSYDLKYNNILIEINGSAYHSIAGHPYQDKGKLPMTLRGHLEKSRAARKNGHHCVHVFDWDDEQKILYLLGTQKKTTLYARKLEIREVDKLEARAFLEKYHLQNDTKSTGISFGLYNGDQLVMLTKWGTPRANNRRKEKIDYELIRLCTHPEYIVVGGFKRLMKHFVNAYNVQSLVSYCDKSKFTGSTYIDAGFVEKENSPGLHFYCEATKEHFTAGYVVQKGFDQLMGGREARCNQVYTKDIFRPGKAPEDWQDIVIKRGEKIPFFNKITPHGSTDNIKLMIAARFHAVPDCGQSTFIRTKSP